ncbi:unnamed protein product [Vitrella brassicaformis CCMP3155]|uniref:Uncharacterized protein n=1 Tax=Vitrella brassicaformis (strain CCMP3155) TaxID=1169540 RepID=A0A0G4EM52_VITBC|nr:unnamed protein product [Vitrella brassicaformis CCMP3155]|eukprot:CEL98525.1 unnamed protein product [Vitrella brassicaformis CCMP3155]
MVTEWDFEAAGGTGGEGVVPRYLTGRSGESIDFISFYCAKRVADVLTEDFTPAHFAALPQPVRRQIVALFSVCRGPNAARHTFPECSLRAVTTFAFPAATTVTEEDLEDGQDGEEGDAMRR